MVLSAGFVLLVLAVTAAAGVFQFGATAWLARLSKRQGSVALAVGLVVYAALLWVRPATLVTSNIIVFAVAALGATVIGRLLADVQTIVAFAVAASVADILSFTAGPTAALLEAGGRGAGSLVAYLTVSVPVAGRVAPVLGVGDLLVLGIFYVALARVPVPGPARLAVPLAGLLAALGVGLAAGGAFGVPFMAGMVVAYLWWVGEGRPWRG